MDRFKDWWDEYWIHIGLLGGLAALLGGIGLLAYYDIDANNRAKARFMFECQQDHKRYECETMWRAGESHTQTVAVPVVIPVGR